MNNRIRNQMKAIRMCDSVHVMGVLYDTGSKVGHMVILNRSDIDAAKAQYGERLQVWEWW